MAAIVPQTFGTTDTIDFENLALGVAVKLRTYK